MFSHLIKSMQSNFPFGFGYNSSLNKIVSNTGWLLSEKILRLLMGFFVGLWVARYFGPEQFGLLNYSIAIIALFGSIGSLGLRTIVVRDLVNMPEAGRITLGTSALLHILGGVVAYFLAT